MSWLSHWNSQVLSRYAPFTRFPESGPLHISDYREFLEESKAIFKKRWSMVITYKEELEQFDKIKTLGTGSFGSVILVKYLKNNKYYAMKMIGKEIIVKSQQLEYLLNEKKILQCTNFPFIIYLHCCFQDSSYVYFIMPYVPVEMFNLMSQFKKLNEIQARFFVSQIVLAIEYLHSLNVIYRDLKPENILVDATGYIKLTDFGFSKLMESKRTFTVCGTPEYIAPEVLLNKGYGFSVDWWGFGILVYEMVAGKTPFHAKTTVKTCANVLACRYKIPKHFSSELKDLVENILTLDLTKRFGNMKHGADEIKSHKWFRPVHWMAVLNRTISPPITPPLPPDPVRDSSCSLYVLPPLPPTLVTDRYASLFQDF